MYRLEFKKPLKLYGDRGYGVETGSWVTKDLDTILSNNAFNMYQSLGTTKELFLDILTDVINKSKELFKIKDGIKTLYIQDRGECIHLLIKYESIL